MKRLVDTITNIITTYKLIITIVLIVGSWAIMAFRALNPKPIVESAMVPIRAEIAQVREKELSDYRDLHAQADYSIRLMEDLGRLSCLNKREQSETAGLPCSELLNNR